jgi:hypothetical protein
VKAAAPRLKARKTQAPPSFLQTTPPPSAPPGRCSRRSYDACGPGCAGCRSGAKPRRVAKIKVVNEKGEIYDKEVVLSDVRQARPVHFQTAPSPNQHEQNIANGRAEMEAEQNAQGFVTNVEKAPSLPITRR